MCLNDIVNSTSAAVCKRNGLVQFLSRTSPRGDLLMTKQTMILVSEVIAAEYELISPSQCEDSNTKTTTAAFLTNISRNVYFICLDKPNLW